MPFCDYCGKSLTDDERHCNSCGKIIVTTENSHVTNNRGQKTIACRIKLVKKIILILGLLGIGCISFYVPWYKIDTSGRTLSLGYDFIWAPSRFAIVEIGRVVATITGFLAFVVSVYISLDFFKKS